MSDQRHRHSNLLGFRAAVPPGTGDPGIVGLLSASTDFRGSLLEALTAHNSSLARNSLGGRNRLAALDRPAEILQLEQVRN